MKKRLLNAEQLKFIAIAAMVTDHCTVIFAPDDYSLWWVAVLRAIGRITAPVMCYFIAEGYHHTSNLKKYMGRLFGAAVISHIPHNLCFGQSVLCFWQATDVLFALFFGLAALCIWNSKKIHAVWFKLFGVGLCCVAAYSADWNYIAVLWILFFGIFHGSRCKQMLAFCGVAVIYMLQPYFYSISANPLSRLGVFLAIPLLLMYNGKRSTRHRKFHKWFFYSFYPAHLLLLYGINIRFL